MPVFFVASIASKMTQFKLKNYHAIVLLFVLVFLAYSNSFNASWQYDDYPGIIRNGNVHLEQLTFKNLTRAFYAPGSSNARRHLSSLSFALNWYFGKNKVSGYHLVNIVIHSCCAVILYFAIRLLLQTPRLHQKYKERHNVIALLSAILWALNPIQTQAVTYIVQRSAAMAALFYLLAMLFYLKARLIKNNWVQIWWFVSCFISFVAAINCKENAVMLPAAIVLVEFIFFDDLKESCRKNHKLFVLISIGVISLFAVWLYRYGGGFAFLSGYKMRPFTLWERICSEPRIVVFYLSLIFWPDPNRLSLVHDLVISRSLFSPWTTLPAILLIVSLLVVGVHQCQKRPLLAFAVLFFLLNHIIESTIVPVQLIFEHRNYLPSLFIFLPLTVAFQDSFNCPINSWRKSFLIFTIITVIAALGTATYKRNIAWQTEESLWIDVWHKAPGDARSYQKLAAYLIKKGYGDKAIDLYKTALTRESQMPTRNKALAYNNMGNIYNNKRDYGMAVKMYNKAKAISPQSMDAWHNLVLSYVDQGDWSKAFEAVNQLLAKAGLQPDYLNLKGVVLLKLNRPREALKYFKHSLATDAHERNYIINYNSALGACGEYDRAFNNLEDLYRENSSDLLFLLSIIENRIKKNDQISVEKFWDIAVKKNGKEGLVQLFNSTPVHLRRLTIDMKLLQRSFLKYNH